MWVQTVKTKKGQFNYPNKIFASTDWLERVSDANICSNSNFFFLNMAD